MPSAAPIHSLYRKCLRISRKLPHAYLQTFFRIKFGDNTRKLAQTSPESHLYARRFERITKEVGKLQHGLDGNPKAFAHVLDLAYGRKGKLRRELIEPLLGDPTVELPPRIIPSIEKSRPPVYSKELSALLMSKHSRTTKPLKEEYLAFPRTLPPRANPQSEEAKLFGPFSKRREVNARWRYFVAESKRVLPPLEVVTEIPQEDGVTLSSSKDDVTKSGIRTMPLQGNSLFDNIDRMVGPMEAPLPTTRKERQSLSSTTDNPPRLALRHPSRWLRRRYGVLLGRTPILTHNRNRKGQSVYSISLSPKAISTTTLYSRRLPEIESDNYSWYRLGLEQKARNKLS